MGLTSVGTAMSAHAFSFLQPGFTTGLPLYAIFPEGLYLINVPQYGVRNSKPSFDLAADSPFFFYQSPFDIGGAHLNMQFSPTYTISRVAGVATARGFYNTYFGIGASWDLGNGWYIGNRFAGFIPQGGAEAYHFGDLEERVGLTYLKDGLLFTITAVLGEPIQSGFRTAPNAFNLDLTLTQQFGKWELGAVAFGSTDLNKPNLTYAMQRQFALGPLIGYDFGSFTVKLKFTTDVAQQNYGRYDRRVEADMIIPVWLAQD